MIIFATLIPIVLTFGTILRIIFKDEHKNEIPKKIYTECKNCNSKNLEYLTAKVKVKITINDITKINFVISTFCIIVLFFAILSTENAEHFMNYIISKDSLVPIINSIGSMVGAILLIKVNTYLIIFNLIIKLLFGKIKKLSIITICKDCGHTDQYYVE